MRFDSRFFHLSSKDGKVFVNWKDMNDDVVAETEFSVDDAFEFAGALGGLAELEERALETAARAEVEVTI